jgi:diacylglycerol kinase (ATP)
MQAKLHIPIGYIPAGSTNDFANSLGIPKEMLKAAERAVGQNRFPCDIGDFNSDTFVYVAAFGLFTEVSYKTSQQLKNFRACGVYYGGCQTASGHSIVPYAGGI